MFKRKLQSIFSLSLIIAAQIISQSLILPLMAVEKSNFDGDKNCNQEPDPNQAQNIIGYGSLMQDESRLRTTPKAQIAYPVMVQGFRRGWYVKNEGKKLGATFLAVVQDSSQQLNAVVYGLSDVTELQATDRRERAYCRTAVTPNQLEILSGELPSGQFWIYTMSETKIPNINFPLVQSYIDIFISGCLEQEERYKLVNFSQQCIKTTNNWSEYWVNDRLYPRRPSIYQPKAFQIDSLLEKNLPEYFNQIKIE